MRGPRVAAKLIQVCQAHDDGPEARMHGDMVAEILRGEGFVSGHEIALAEPEILYEDRIAGKGCLAGVPPLQAPRPEILRGMQPEGGAVVQLMGFAGPNEPVASRRRNVQPR